MRTEASGFSRGGESVHSDSMTSIDDGKDARQIPVEPSAEELGFRIAELRHAKGITIASLAEAAELSTGLVSQIERGNGNPSYLTMLKLAQALEVPISHFFVTKDRSASGRVVRADARSQHLNFEGDISFEVLTPDLRGKLAMVWGTAAPGWTNEGAPYQHEGDGEESLLVLSGSLGVNVGDESYVLHAGDTITFASAEPHWYATVGEENVVLVQAIAPPKF